MENPKLYIDSHTHLDWYENQELLIKNLVESGIVCLAASVDADSFKKNLQIAEKVNTLAGKQQIIPTFGVHPCKVKEMLKQVQHDKMKSQHDEGEVQHDKMKSQEVTLNLFQGLLSESPIIGEIGMDFCWYKEASPDEQEKVFRFFLEHCEREKKYCVIHTKDAEKQIADILKDYPDAKPIIHWYDGPEDIYKEFIKRGYLFTFGCETIRNKHIQKLLKQTPVEQLLCETDNPTGEPWLGGNDNSPMLIKRIYSDVANILGIEKDILIQQIQKNFQPIYMAAKDLVL